MKKTYTIENIDCASCAAKAEALVKKVAGVRNATLNFWMETLTIEASDENFAEIEKEVKAACYRAIKKCVVKG